MTNDNLDIFRVGDIVRFRAEKIDNDVLRDHDPKKLIGKVLSITSIDGRSCLFCRWSYKGECFANVLAEQVELVQERTYEGILKELAEKLNNKEHHHIDIFGDVTFSAPSDYMGEMDVEIEYTAADIAAIYEASREIAELFRKEGKNNG